MSSRLIQVTVAPTGTVTECGPKLKLSIVTSTTGAEGFALAATLGDAANSNTAIITGAAKPAIHTHFFVIVLFPF
jgi:hypothetical protein